MSAFFSYILFSGAILLSLYLLYKWLLSRETFSRFNRFFLLAAYAVSFAALPLKDAAEGIAAARGGEQSVAVEMGEVEFGGAVAEVSEPLLPNGLISAIFVVYLLGVAVVVVLTLIVAMRIALTIRRGERSRLGRFTLVLTENSRLAPFSICGYIIVNRRDYAEANRMVLAHEINHQSRMHWVDLMVAQAVVALQWFNPAAWLMRDELRSVHEYQADMSVIESGADAREYQLLLIKKAIGAKFPALANCLNHSNLKKRITMMLKSKSSPWARMRALAAIPAVVAVAAVVNPDALAAVLTPSKLAPEAVAVSADKISDFSLKVENRESEKNEAAAAAVTVVAAESAAQPAEAKNEAEAEPAPKLFVDGVEVSRTILDAMDPKAIKSMTVDKKNNAIYIETKSEAETDAPAASAESMPEFPGGDSALLKFISDNIQYPSEAYKEGREGRVVVRFVISESGKVTDPTIVRSVSDDLDLAAIDVISKLPDFTPGMTNGKPVACKYTIPVMFKLSKPAPAE